MTDQEFKYWKTITNISSTQWIEDRITNFNGRGHLYYTGGTDGVYMRISPNGELSLGTYEFAFPHIGDAMFTERAAHKYDSENDALTAAFKIGGMQFLVDMFRTNLPKFPDDEDSEAEQPTMDMSM